MRTTHRQGDTDHGVESGQETAGDPPRQPGTTASDESFRFLVSIHHPAQSHFYRYIIDQLRANGHEVRVCVRDKEMASALLESFGIDHSVLARKQGSWLRVALTQAAYEAKLLREAWRFDPHVLTSVGGIEISHVAPLVGARALAFTDTPTGLGRFFTAPSIRATCTPSSFAGRVRGRQRTYDGYQELAYLHPDRFEPDTERLRSFGVDPDEPLFIVRFVRWQSYHDVGEHGFSREQKRALVSMLADHGTVYITSETPLPDEFAAYDLPIPPELMHDLLAVADLYVGDSGTMATEAAILGTPSVRSNSNVAGTDRGNFVELEESFDLLRSYADGQRALEEVERLLADPAANERWRDRRERLLEEKIDVTSYAVAQLEGCASGETQP